MSKARDWEWAEQAKLRGESMKAARDLANNETVFSEWPSQEPEEPVLRRIHAISREIGLRGSVAFFGSHASGLQTATSDCDVVFIPEETGEDQGTPVMMLQLFAQMLPKHGYSNIVTVFQAVVPLLKAVDPDGLDVDLSVANVLGFHNSRLLGAYCRMDERVARLARLVKQWAHHHELISSSDGHLNSYSYSLLVVFFLMQTSPPIVPNLQALAEGDANAPLVHDKRWGTEQTWECGYWELIDLVPRTWNTQSLEELLVEFFEFYIGFDWGRNAVSIRLALKCGVDSEGRRQLPDKFSGLRLRVAREVWYVEDPFDLGHNLAAKCSSAGRRRICDCLRQTHEAMKSSQGRDVLKAFDAACPEAKGDSDNAVSNRQNNKRTYLIRCRVNHKKVTPQAFANALADFSVESVHFPLQASSQAAGPDNLPEAFILFPSDRDRKEAHTINETYVNGWQLRLFVTSHYALEDAKSGGAQFETIDGWEATVKDEADIQDSKPGKSAKQKNGRWKESANLNSIAKKEVDKQLQRVIDGVAQAEGSDELNVLLQRAKALSLSREVTKCEEKLRGIREARSDGSRSRHVSGSPRLGPSPNPVGAATNTAGWSPASGAGGGGYGTAPGSGRGAQARGAGAGVQFQ